MSSARWWRRYFLRRQEKNKSRIILGIDPGSIVCGYGIIKTVNSEQLRVNSKPTLSTGTVYVASGRIMLPSKQPLDVRLKELYANLADIIREYSPVRPPSKRSFCKEHKGCPCPWTGKRRGAGCSGFLRASCLRVQRA